MNLTQVPITPNPGLGINDLPRWPFATGPSVLLTDPVDERLCNRARFARLLLDLVIGQLELDNVHRRLQMFNPTLD